jgi:hypothetical protein
MLKNAHNVFAIVMIFLSKTEESKHITIELFEAIDTSGVTMASKLWLLLDKFSFT